jgi:hypothetical protein
MLHLELRPRRNGPAKVQGLLWDSLGLGARDYPVAKAKIRAVDGLPNYKVCLGSSLKP